MNELGKFETRLNTPVEWRTARTASLKTVSILGATVPLSRGMEKIGEPSSVSRSVSSFDGISVHYDSYPASSSSAVVIVPGFWRTRRHPSMIRLARFLQGIGYGVAVVDVRGHGDTAGTYGFNRHEHEDVAAVVRDLTLKDGASHVVLLGLSVGGSIAVSTAARNDLPLSGLILVSPVAELSKVVPRLNPFTMHRHIALRQAFNRPRFDWKFSTSPKLRATEDIGRVHVPVTLIHVKNDWLVGHRNSELLYAAANQPKEIHLLEIAGNYHADRVFGVASEQIDPLVTSFLERTLPK